MAASARPLLSRPKGKNLASLATAAVVFLGLLIQIGCAGVTASPSSSGGGQTGGNGSGSPTMTLNPLSISFGDVTVGSTLSENVTISNTGTSTLTISQASLTGSEFTLTGVSLPLSIAVGQQATATVGFSPTSAGNATGSISIASNASPSSITVSLSGTGVTTATVGLTWTASTSSGVTGYNVYRGTTQGTYSRISSSVTGTTYSDSTVESGQDLTYYYVVTAVNSSGQESADSNAASVKVP